MYIHTTKHSWFVRTLRTFKTERTVYSAKVLKKSVYARLQYKSLRKISVILLNTKITKSKEKV